MNDNELADALDRGADDDNHECSEVSNWAGGYDCTCGMSGWYTHLSQPPHRGCSWQYELRQAAARLRELSAENERLRTAGDRLAQAARVASGLTAQPKGGWYHLNAAITGWAALGEES